MPLMALATSHPIALVRIIHRLLAKRPDDRYQSASALERDLRAIERNQPGLLSRLAKRLARPRR